MVRSREMKFFVCFVLLFVFASAAENFRNFEWAQETLTRSEVEEKLVRYLKKDGRIENFFSLDEEKLNLFNAPKTDSDKCLDFSLKFTTSKLLKPVSGKKKNLVGIKIALDPGHLGGKYAQLERRFIDIPPSINRRSSIVFDEGTLSFLTAHYLKVLLEKEGAIVMITRDKIGKGVYYEDFFEWLKHSSDFWCEHSSLSELFKKYYNPLDLRARAKKINAFSPDLTLVIHYNSHQEEGKYSSNSCVSSKNYNMVFVPGAFCFGELNEEESRYEFIRLLVTSDLDESFKLSRCVLDSFVEKLHVPAVDSSHDLRYLDTVCLKIEEGIYSRNLALTRLIHGPLCYGETLIQNNVDESLNLARKDFVINGIPCSSRIKEVAEAYFEGILNYLCE